MRNTTFLWLLASTALSAHGGETATTSSVRTTTLSANNLATQTATSTAAVSGAIGFTAAQFPVNQSAGSVTLVVQRSSGTAGAMSVTYSTTSETAVAPANYTAEIGTLKWANGDGSNKTITIPVNSANVFTGTKYFVVRLAAGANSILGAHTSTTVTITGGTAPTGFVSFPDDLPGAGSNGSDPIPAGAGLEDTRNPDHVIGNGTPSSCTSAAVVAAVKSGGIITFECGSAPVTIQMTQTAQLFNNGAAKTVIDGGGLVTLSGMNQRRILYMNTCDESLVWTTTQCQDQEYPQLTVQNLTFSGGNAANESSPEGGAIYALGGRIKVVNSRFFSNVCASADPNLLFGGAISTFEQYQSLPVYVVHSTFGGEPSLGNTCNDGGALGSIGVSWTIVNSLLDYNHAASGGAIYNDGVNLNLLISGSLLEYNQATTFGSSIFFVSDNVPGSIVITDSTIKGNTGGTWYDKYPSISAEADTPITVKNSTISN
jgi:hypothetical protein